MYVILFKKKLVTTAWPYPDFRISQGEVIEMDQNDSSWLLT